MADIVIENLSDETHRGLERLALAHGQTVEFEIRAILAAAAISGESSDIGSALARLGARFGGIDLDITRDPSLVRMADFD